MPKLNVAFDVDGTLIDLDNMPNYPVIDLLRWFESQHHRVFIWSGGGCDYARHWADKLGFTDVPVIEKNQKSALDWGIQLTVDDMPIELGHSILNILIG